MSLSHGPPRVILEIPTTTFGSEQELVERLVAHAPASEARYLYRGQAREYRRRWPMQAQPYRPLSADDLIDPRVWRFEPDSIEFPIPLLPGTLDLPSLIPTDTREYERFLADPSASSSDAFDEMMVRFRALVCLFLVGVACLRNKDRAASDWMGEMWDADRPYLYRLRSIGQHYGMDTGLLDATSSLEVALWFATHDFCSGTYRPGDTAVVYRIDRQILPAVEQWLRAIPEHEGEFDATTVDLRGTPASVAARASRQQGWSLVGWDHPRTMVKMVASGGLTRFVFPTGGEPSSENTLTREFLVPSDDPVGTLFERFEPEVVRSLGEAQAWIDRHWNVVGGDRIELDENGDWLDGLTPRIGSILDHYAAMS